MRRHQRRELSAYLQRVPLLAFLISGIFLLSGCEAIKGIFKAGVWVGVIAVVAVIAVGGGIAAMLKK